MSRPQIRDGTVEISGERIPFLSGEVHYWRLNPSVWPVVLDRVHEIGLPMVATYIPWQYHELAPGRFDFTGETEAPRNLVGFLKLAGEKGLRVFIRPGPYIYAEWRNAGVPDRVIGLPRLSEAYRAEARVWMKAVVNAIAPFCASEGEDAARRAAVPIERPIVLFQPDNEMDVFTHWFEDRCGLGDPRCAAARQRDGGFFQEFLRERYNGDVGTLNSAWGASYGAFEEAQAFAEAIDGHEPHARARAHDYWNFQHWATRESLKWHVEEYRRLGVKLPMIANYYPGGDVQNWREVARAGADAQGVDWYPKNQFGREPLERAKEYRLFMDTCRLQSVYSALPSIPELECGVWHGYQEHVGLLAPSHYRLMAVSALMAGIKGLNWYMLVNRDNWYGSAINERGEWRGEIAEVLMGFHRVWREVDPPALTRRVLCGVCFDPGQIGPENLLNENPVLSALHEAGIDHDFFDPLHEESAARPVVFYAGADWLAESAQRRLIEYMESGGALVVFRSGPSRDERMRACDLLGVRGPDRVLSKLGKKVELRPAWGGDAGIAEGSVWVWDNPPGDAVIAEQVAGKQQAVECADAWMRGYIGQRWAAGYREPRGRGWLIVLGVAPTASVVRAVVGWCGAELPSESDTPGVMTAVFDDPRGETVLMASNLNTGPAGARVRIAGLRDRGRVRVEDVWEGTSEVMESDRLVIRLAGLSAGVWRVRAGG
ncbi:MAG: beta-galactosidase [Phycisphaerales bacterium]|nr:beta-galactosidase [Phycisphaerales bacterium]